MYIGNLWSVHISWRAKWVIRTRKREIKQLGWCKPYPQWGSEWSNEEMFFFTIIDHPGTRNLKINCHVANADYSSIFSHTGYWNCAQTRTWISPCAQQIFHKFTIIYKVDILHPFSNPTKNHDGRWTNVCEVTNLLHRNNFVFITWKT